MDTASSEPNERDAPIGFAKDLWTRVREHDISGLAAELAYRFLFALFPFLLFVASLGSFVARAVGLDNPTDNIIAGLGDNLPAALAATIRPEVQRVVEEQHPDLASLGALLALWAATSGTMTIVKAMNRAYGVRETRSLPARYALGLVLTIAGSIAVVTSFVTIVGGTVLTGQVVQSLGMTQAWGVISLARWPIIFIFLVAGTTILFRVGPDMRPPWRAAVLGAVVFTVGWLVATLGVALYVGNIANYGATYGALAGVIVLMLWLYLTGFVLLLGAEVVAIVTLRIAPERLADHVRDNDPTFAIERGGRAARRAIGGVREALDDRGGEPGRPAQLISRRAPIPSIRPSATLGGVDPLTQHLRTMLGPEAEFRDGQREAIEAVARDGQRALVVQRTGWGKSLVYWIATRVRRDEGHGPTLIVSPLLALMRNQIAMAERLGIRAATIHSGNVEEWDAVQHGLASDAIDVLLISPERLANERFTTDVLPSISGSIGLFVVDEAHCISDWGHDFRPDYRRIGRILQTLDRRVPVLATTATANDRVVDDIIEQLGDGVRVFRGPLGRASLRLDAIDLGNQAERLAWLAERIPQMAGSGIVYCLTVADTQRVATFLRSQGIDAQPYNAALTQGEREALEDALIAGEIKALVATVALGMGFDKPDLGFVIHYQRPASAIAYYQQVGRAGRAVEHADGVLLSGREDDEIAEYFMRTAFPPTVHMHEILTVLDEVQSMSGSALEKRVNLGKGQIAQALKLLELDGAVARAGGRYTRTAEPWAQDEERIERVQAARRSELEQMHAYMRADGCLMEFLIRLLDDPAAAPCGQCANCTGRGQPRTVDPELVRAAVSFLRRDLRSIKPRALWAPDAVAGLSGKIKPPNEVGMALSVYGDAGWGRDVQRGRTVDGRFDRELVGASARAIRDRWRPTPEPAWVTAVPSTSRPGLTEGLGRALAADLGLPFVDVFAAATDGEPQEGMQNSAQQLRNVHAKLSIDGAAVLDGPVLLVDDIVDSGWTLTVAGAFLREQGSGAVHPFALATATGRDN